MFSYFIKKDKDEYLPDNIIDYEECIIVQFQDDYELKYNDEAIICVLLSNYSLFKILNDSFITKNEKYINNEEDYKIISIGPRPSFKTSWCSNVVDVFKRLNIKINRIEIFKRYLVEDSFTDYKLLYDKMTEQIYDNIYFATKNSENTTNLNNTINKNIYESFESEFEDSYLIDLNDLPKLNIELGLSLDEDDIKYYKEIFGHRKITNVELYDLSQSNSEHSRHWFFNGKYNIYTRDNKKSNYNKKRDFSSLFQQVKSTNLFPDCNSLIAFKDNASSIIGYEVDNLIVNKNNQYGIYYEKVNPTHTAETHNFPTGICPFPGASTGAGGRIRDQISIGRGGKFVSGYVGYSVGTLFNEDERSIYPCKKPEDILIQASNGASDYGNKIGEPIILGYTRSFGMHINNELNLNNPKEQDYFKKNPDDLNKEDTRYEYVKPIMYSGGVGMLNDSNVKKGFTELGNLVVRVGGPAYNIGLGGGSASSRNQDTKNESLDFNAVQRGDPQMENKVSRFVEVCSNLEYNPIISIHDQGSGGMGNVTKEIMAPNGGLVTLNKVNLGEPNLSSNIIWNAEYQEQCTILINYKDIKLIKTIAEKENVNLEFVGVITDSGKIDVHNKNDKILKIVDFNLDEVLEHIPRKQYDLYKNDNNDNDRISYHNRPTTPSIDNFISSLQSVLKNVNVGSKRFLTNKVDRSVSGLIAQQQCIGPFHLPLSNYSITALGYFDLKGTVASIGEQPIKGIMNNKSGIEMSIGEMLTNLIFVKITNFNDIKCLGNWMWSPKLKGQGYLLYEAGNHCVEVLKKLKIGIDGGKDSLSMNTNINNETVISPNTFVISSYVNCNDVNCKVTPDIKSGDGTSIIFVDLGYGKCRLGGSQYCQEIKNLNYECPRFENIDTFPFIFSIIQKYIGFGKLLSGHDRSDGGLITTLIEMCISSPFGMEIDIDLEKIDYNFNNNFFIKNTSDFSTDIDYMSYLFNEELGLVFEIDNRYKNQFMESINYYCPCYVIGKTIPDRIFKLTYNNINLLNTETRNLWNIWESTSFKLEKMQSNLECIEEEKMSINNRISPYFNISDNLMNLINNLEKFESTAELNLSLNLPYDSSLTLSPNSNNSISPISNTSSDSLSPKINIINKSQSLSVLSDNFMFLESKYKVYRVGIVREEGSNGDKEMAAAFLNVGFEVYDITMNDIIKSNGKLIHKFNGLAFVGGFSFSDVLGSSVGWSASIIFNDDIKQEFKRFYNDESKFSLGVCNGCQLMSLIGFIPEVRLVENKSTRFESRCVSIKIYKNSNSIFLKDMEDIVFNMWSAHGEGRFLIEDEDLIQNIKCNGSNFNNENNNKNYINKNICPIRYADDYGNATEKYPFNPNGSVGGVAGISSLNGRHFALMPHPERCILKWQLPYVPGEYREKLNIYSPWIYIFKNAYNFCKDDNHI